ncbi:MAG: neutral/alkaline non-lysosomal ceramidase N-terminal domain-containing protein [Planctomycetota bacterium]
MMMLFKVSDSRKYWVYWLLWLAFAPAILAQEATAPALRAGAATSNITPQLGGGIVGGFAPVPSTDIHDELHARCLVLDDGRSQLALVVCDLLGIHHEVSQAARRRIEQQTGIPATHVLISATHTHSATSALGAPRYQLDIELDDYQQFVVQRIADGVQRAKNRLRPAEIGFGNVDIPDHLFNRRWYMRDGTVPPNPFGTIDRVKMNPPAGSPDLVEPAGPIDPSVSIISVREPGGHGIAAFTAWSLHYVGGTGPGSISADYFGMYCRELERLQALPVSATPFVAMMANGTSGDINNINFRNPRPSKPAWEQMRFVAHDAAEKVHNTLSSLQYRSDVALHAAWRDLEVGLRHPSPEQLHWADQVLTQPAPPAGKVDLPRVYAERVRSLELQPATASIPLQLLQLGPVCIGTMPCEVFCEIGLEFRRRSPAQPAFLVSLGHGYFGYLPTPAQHLLGGYETWLGTNRLEVNASDKMLAALLEMAATVKSADGGSERK